MSGLGQISRVKKAMESASNQQRGKSFGNAATTKSPKMTLDDIKFDQTYKSGASRTEDGRKVLLNGSGGHYAMAVALTDRDKNGAIKKQQIKCFAYQRDAEGQLKQREKFSISDSRAEVLLPELAAYFGYELVKVC